MCDRSFASAVGFSCSIAAIARRSGQSSTGGSRHSFSGIKLLSLLLTLFALFAASSVSASTATAVKWQSYNGSPGALSAGSFTVVAPNVYDGPVGDTATGYSLASSGTLCVLWDMGSSISISGYRTQFTGGGSNYAYYSADGNTWTSLAGPVSGTQQTFTAITARYVQFVIAGSGESVTDTRLYDGAGALIIGPGSTPDFSLSAAATSQSIAAGQSGPADSLAITSVNSFAGAVSLAASCAQAGITETVTPASTAPPANGTSSSSLTVSVAAGTPQGTYAVTVTGTSGALTHTATVSVSVLNPPSAPTGLSATGGNQYVSLAWTAPAGSGLTYNVYRGTVALGESPTPLNGSALSSTSYIDSTAANGTTYYYIVKAVNGSGTGAASNEASAAALTIAPLAPQSLSAIGTAGKISLAWTAPAGTGLTYSIYRGSVAGGESATALASGLTATTDADTAVTGGSTYFYVVKAVNAYGTSAASGEASAAAPLASTGPAYVAASPYYYNESQITWSAVSSATSYNIYRGTVSGQETLISSGQAGPSFIDTNNNAYLTTGTTYYYQVTAMGPGGESGRSPEVTLVGTTAAQTLPAPGILRAVAGSGQVTLTWSSVASASTYNLYRGGWLYQAGLLGTSYLDTGLTNGTTYSYQVAGVVSAGQGALSSASAATPGSTAIAAPLLAAQSSGSGNAAVTLYFNPVTGATGYNIYRSTSAGGEGSLPFATTVGTAAQGYSPGLSYSDTATTSGTTYYYRVTAVNNSAGSANAGESSLSAEVSVLAASTSIPAPAITTATAGSGQILVRWGAIPGAVTYDLYRGTGTYGSNSNSALVRTGLTGTSCTDTTAANGTSYSYFLTAVNATGQSTLASYTGAPPQGLVFATPGSTPLAAPLVAATASSQSVSVQWNSVSGAASYNLYRSTSAGAEGVLPIATGIPTTTSGLVLSYDGLTQGAVNGTVVSGSTYYYKVTPVSLAGEGVLSGEVSAAAGSPLLPAPGSLAALPIYGGVTLSWNSVTGAASYNVYRQSGGVQTLLATGITSLSFTDSTSGPVSSYYSVYAVSAAGQGSSSSLLAAPNDFSLSISPSPVTAGVGTTGVGDIAITRSGTLASTAVNLSLTGAMPAGVSASFFPQSPDHTNSSLLFCVGAGAVAGTYNFTLTGSVPGSPSPLTHSIPVTLTITSP